MTAQSHDDVGARWSPGGQAAFHRFTTRERCPHCDHDAPCISFDNGDILCHRVGDPAHWTDSFIGGYWHRALDASDERATPATPRRLPAPSSPAPHTAGPDTRDRVNRRLLEICPLSTANHAYVADLHAHADYADHANLNTLYGTLPPAQAQGPLIAALVEEFGHDTLMTVPGFVVRDGRLRLNGAGLLVAIIDVAGRLVGFQVRYGPGDYRWLSSTNGPSTGAPYHLARPRVLRDHRVYIVEAPKTANILADRLGAVVIATAGHSNWKVAREPLEHLIAHEGAEVVVIGLDADDPDAKAATVAQVEHSRQQLVTAARRLGFCVKVARWAHADGKGPDDLLATGHTWDLTVHRQAAASAETSATPLIDPRGPTGDGAMVSVEPYFLAWLIQQTAATVELRARYHYVLAVARDPALNDGQKLTEIVLFSHLPLPVGRSATPPEPVTVAAATIAYDLGSPGTKQKDGSLRPTKLSTVTKNLGDLINLGVRTRDEVVTERVITLPNKRDKTGPPIKKTITVTNYAYHGSGSLPGQRMTRDEARVAATRAKADRERPRCSRCYGARLKPRSYVCEDCGHASSSADAARAGRAIVEDSHGRFIHHATGEVIEPGVRVAGAGCPPVSSNRNPVTDRGRLSPEGSDTRDRNPVTVEADGGRGRGAGTHDRIPVTKEPSRESNWNPVTAPIVFPSSPSSVEDEGSAASTNLAVTLPHVTYAAMSPPCSDDVAREEEHGDPDADWI